MFCILWAGPTRQAHEEAREQAREAAGSGSLRRTLSVKEDRSVVAPVFVAYAVGAAMAYLPVAVGKAGNLAPVHATVAVALFSACLLTPVIAGRLIGRSHDESRELALLALMVGLPAVVSFSLLASGVNFHSLLPLLLIIFTVMFGSLLGYVGGRDGAAR
jgi:hypothetical protein